MIEKEQWVRGIAIIAPKVDAAMWAGHIEAAWKRWQFPEHHVPLWLAHCAHESQGFTRLGENLNYSAARAYKVFGKKYFPTVDAAVPYAFKPAKLANCVYANRMGNGDVASGDGWRFAGAGLIQLTGRTNHTRFFNAMQMPLMPDWLRQPTGAAMSAAWFWNANVLPKVLIHNPPESQLLDFTTKAVNGGLNGVNERGMLWVDVLKVWA